MKKKIKIPVEKLQDLKGDPHSIAMGVAVGVFVSITPTIPLHTVIALAIAYILKASKPAAAIGVWVCNPFTVVFFYFASYKVGVTVFGDALTEAETVRAFVENIEKDIDIHDKIVYFVDFIRTRLKLFFIMLAGGIILGMPAGVISYFITKDFILKIRSAKAKLRSQRQKHDTSGKDS
ncbi:MAG: DUF2062 domain-containing protein [Desulfarculaceae bacterium]|nr:DUF2062 domain-containing protein [Desulfarculaceae bacterium]